MDDAQPYPHRIDVENTNLDNHGRIVDPNAYQVNILDPNTGRILILNDEDYVALGSMLEELAESYWYTPNTDAVRGHIDASVKQVYDDFLKARPHLQIQNVPPKAYEYSVGVSDDG